MSTSQLKPTQNLFLGLIINAVLAVASFYMIAIPSLLVTNLKFTSIGIGCAMALASLTYFGRYGLRKIDVGFRGTSLLFEKRTGKILFSEGWVWWWPKPIGDVQVKDVRKVPLDFPIEGVLTRDNVLVRFDLAMELEIEDVEKAFGVDNVPSLLENGSDDILRSIVSKINADQVTKARIPIMEILRNGTEKEHLPKEMDTVVEEKEKKELAELELEGLEPYAIREWGYRIRKFRITTIRLPDEIQDARAKIQVENAQRVSEMTEVGTLKKIMKALREENPKLSDSELLAAGQAIQGKRTIFNIEGSADPLTKAGLLSSLNK